MKLRSLWCPPAGLGANKRCQIICDPSTLARLAAAAVEPRKHSSLAQSYERRGSGPNFAAALRASNHVNVRKTNAPQSRRAATAADVTDYIDCRGHDRTIHQPLARRNIGRSGGCMPTSIGNDPGFFLVFFVRLVKPHKLTSEDNRDVTAMPQEFKNTIQMLL